MTSKTIKLISWNVAGIRAAIKKGLWDFVKTSNADIFCFQEVKARPDQIPNTFDKPAMFEAWNPAAKAGYSGVATFSKPEPKTIIVGDRDNDWDDEGRVIITKYDEFTLLNIYFPNGKKDKARLQYKLDFYDYFLKYILDLRKNGERVIFCGDVNTAHSEIDLSRPKDNEKTSGFLPIERQWIDKVVDSGFVDTYRYFHPSDTTFSWWDQKTRSRERNIGWRIDYFFVDKSLIDNLVSSDILTDIYGSDHCPISLEMQI